MIKTIDKTKYIQVQKKNLYIELPHENEDKDILKVLSYDEHIGYIDKQHSLFVTWGYGQYSATTSRHITTICRDYSLTRIDVSCRYDALIYIMNKSIDIIDKFLQK